MAAADTAAGLAAFEGRAAGTDAERRAAIWLKSELSKARRDAQTETFWCRPNWALASAWHCALAIAGSLLMVHHAELGGALTLAALISILLDALTGISPGRRLTREHASQNVFSPAPADRRVHLIVTANYDAGRTGLVYKDALRALTARLKKLTGGLTPGWLGWFCIELLWLLGVAVIRHGGSTGTWIGIVQLVPTVVLVLQLAALLELAIASSGPAANDNASGAATAIALVRALDASPPRNLGVELVLQGAGDGAMTGLRRHLRGRRRELRRADTVVIGIGPCGAGAPCWWVSDGPLIPLRYMARLRNMAQKLSSRPASPAALPHRARGTSPAFPARTRFLPALTIGCVDRRDIAPRSHQQADVPDALDRSSMDALLQFGLALVDEIDADLSRVSDRSGAASAAA